MWYANVTFSGPTAESVSITRDEPIDNEVCLAKSLSLRLLLTRLPEWATPLLDDFSKDILNEMDEKKVTMTIQTEPYATVAIHLRDTDKDDCLARKSSGPQGLLDVSYDFDFDEDPVIVLTIIADNHKLYRLEMSLPRSDMFLRPYLTREAR